MINDSQIRQLARYVDANFKRVEKEMNQLLRFKATVEAEKQADALQKAMDKEQAAGESYTKIIIAAGYAGFLTFWGKSAGDIPPPWHAAIGAMMLLSMILFVIWEVSKSVWKGISLNRAMTRLQQDRTPRGVTNFTESMEAFNRRAHRVRDDYLEHSPWR